MYATANYTLGATATSAAAALTLNNQSASEPQLQVQLPGGSFTLGSKGPSQIAAGAPTGVCAPKCHFYTDSNSPNPLYECIASAWVPASISGGGAITQAQLQAGGFVYCPAASGSATAPPWSMILVDDVTVTAQFVHLPEAGDMRL